MVTFPAPFHSTGHWIWLCVLSNEFCSSAFFPLAWRISFFISPKPGLVVTDSQAGFSLLSFSLLLVWKSLYVSWFLGNSFLLVSGRQHSGEGFSCLTDFCCCCNLSALWLYPHCVLLCVPCWEVCCRGHEDHLIYFFSWSAFRGLFLALSSDGWTLMG